MIYDTMIKHTDEMIARAEEMIAENERLIKENEKLLGYMRAEPLTRNEIRPYWPTLG